MWQPDGWAQTRIGLLTPHADVGPEAEFQAMGAPRVSIHAARVPLGVYKAGGTMDQTIASNPARAFADPPVVDDAAELLAAAPLKPFCLADACACSTRCNSSVQTPLSSLLARLKKSFLRILLKS